MIGELIGELIDELIGELIGELYMGQAANGVLAHRNVERRYQNSTITVDLAQM